MRPHQVTPRVRFQVFCLLLASIAACTGSPPSHEAAKTEKSSAGTGSTAQNTAVGKQDEWLVQGKDLAQTRYSELAEINANNAANLKVAWTFATGVLRGHEGAPLVHDNTMYVVSPFPNILFALDLTKPGSPVKWEYHPNPDKRAIGIACCDVVNRGWTFDDGKIFYNTLDAHTVAVDAATGKEIWHVKVGDTNLGETMTMAPIVVKHRVIVGNSGGEMGVRGWVVGLDEGTGKEVWRAYSTGPDSEVKIGAGFHAFYPKDQGKDLGVTSWNPHGYLHGAGTAWGWFSYDPDLNLIYYGTSNPGPWNQDQRPGDNKWTSTLFARNPETGEAAWATQITPHDMWDYDATNEYTLVDLPFGGRVRKTLVHFDRNAFAYVIDRTNGEIISAQPFTPLNWATGIDIRTSLPQVVEAKKTKQGVNVTDICPQASGGKDQQPSAYSPRTHLFYVPTNNVCMDYEGVEASFIAGTPYFGAKLKTKMPGPGGYSGEFMAWDPVNAKKVWGIKEDLPVWSGVLATAGDVVFYGTLDGWFKAVNAVTGKVLWQFKCGSGIIGAPMTYRGPDGKQYIAILSGFGGAAPVPAGFATKHSLSGELYVFSL
ncbi:MAG: PQQ-dependent dehydrogenase, methanol/ethanol family [Gemmatimonadota bacterium]|nr:PQQ-dependent dehydrogenase, methanol/ethanol family [Gemmatimonadota bacterium]